MKLLFYARILNLSIIKHYKNILADLKAAQLLPVLKKGGVHLCF